MKPAHKIILGIALTPFLLVIFYAGFCWITYISDPVLTGSKYGFTIGSTKEQTYGSIGKVKNQHPKLVIYITYGERAGDKMTLQPTNENFTQVKKYGHWELLLDGEGEFSNNIRLIFEDKKLVKIYRHRKYFELP